MFVIYNWCNIEYSSKTLLYGVYDNLPILYKTVHIYIVYNILFIKYNEIGYSV